MNSRCLPFTYCISHADKSLHTSLCLFFLSFLSFLDILKYEQNLSFVLFRYCLFYWKLKTYY